MKILIDMNLSPAWCQVLRARGFVCRHWSDIGDPRASDAVLLKWAKDNDFVVLTHDLDFGALLAASQAHRPSVVQIRTQDVMPEAMERLILDVLRKYRTELDAGALIVVDETRLRVRILPLMP